METKLAYKFDKTTKEFLNAVNAQRNPKRQSEYLLPANSTFTAPPTESIGQTAVWDGTTWNLTPDHRKQSDRFGKHRNGDGVGFYPPDAEYDTQIQYMEDLGDYPTGSSLIRPAKPVSVAKKEKCDENDRECANARFNQSLTVTVDDIDLVFIPTAQTRADMESVLASVLRGKPRAWVDEVGTEFTFTTMEQANKILNKFDELSDRCYEIWNEFNSEIQNAQTTEEVESIIIDYGVN